MVSKYISYMCCIHHIHSQTQCAGGVLLLSSSLRPVPNDVRVNFIPRTAGLGLFDFAARPKRMYAYLYALYCYTPPRRTIRVTHVTIINNLRSRDYTMHRLTPVSRAPKNVLWFRIILSSSVSEIWLTERAGHLCRTRYLCELYTPHIHTHTRVRAQCIHLL